MALQYLIVANIIKYIIYCILLFHGKSKTEGVKYLWFTKMFSQVTWTSPPLCNTAMAAVTEWKAVSSPWNIWWPETWMGIPLWDVVIVHIGVSKNRGWWAPQIIHLFIGIVHYFNHLFWGGKIPLFSG